MRGFVRRTVRTPAPSSSARRSTFQPETAPAPLPLPQQGLLAVPHGPPLHPRRRPPPVAGRPHHCPGVPRRWTRSSSCGSSPAWPAPCPASRPKTRRRPRPPHRDRSPPQRHRARHPRRHRRQALPHAGQKQPPRSARLCGHSCRARRPSRAALPAGPTAPPTDAGADGCSLVRGDLQHLSERDQLARDFTDGRSGELGKLATAPWRYGQPPHRYGHAVGPVRRSSPGSARARQK